MAVDRRISRMQDVIPIRTPDLVATAVPVPTAAAVSPLYEFFFSGDRYLNTPSPYSGGVIGTGLGTAEAVETSDWFGSGWNERTVDPWPVFGGTAFRVPLYMINHPSDDLGFLMSSAPCGNFEIPGICDPGLPFIAQAMLSDTWIRVEFSPWTGGDATFGTDLWGDQSAGYPVPAYDVEIATSAVVQAANADSLACIPMPGELPTAVAVWSSSGVLYAVSFKLQMSTSYLIWNQTPHLTITAGAPVVLSADFTKGSAGLDLAWCPATGSDPVCLAWRSSTGISIGALSLSSDGQPVIANVSTPLTGAAPAVDVGWLSEGSYAVIRGEGRVGTPAGDTPAYAVVTLASGAVTASGTIGGLTQVRGTTVGGRVAILGRAGSRWALRISNETHTAFDEHDGGPSNTDSTPPLHGADLLGHPDGRLITYVRDRYEQYGALLSIVTWLWAPLMMWTVEGGVPVQRDAVEPPVFDSVFNIEHDLPLRLTAQTDRLFGIEQSGSQPEAPMVHMLSWSSMVPNFWFMQMHYIGGNRFVVSWSPTDFEEWRALVPDGLEYRDHPQALFAFQIDAEGVITGVSNIVHLHDWGYALETPVAGDGTGNRFWATPVYSTAAFAGNTALQVHTFDLDDSMVLTEVGSSEAVLTDYTATFGTAVYMGDGIVVIPWGLGLRALRLDDAGNLTGDAISPITTIQLLAGDFNDTSGCAIKRVGDTDFVASVGYSRQSGANLDFRGQLAVTVFRLDRVSLEIAEVETTTPWIATSPNSPSEFFGFHSDSTGASEFDFSTDGRHIAFPIETIIDAAWTERPWQSTTPGTQAWYPEGAVDGLQQFAWVTISDQGTISVEYLRIAADYQGTVLPAQPNEGGDSTVAGFIDPEGPAIRVFQAFTRDYLDRGLMVCPTSDTQIVATGYIDGDARANEDVFIANSAYFYVMSFTRQGDTMHLDAITPQWISDDLWHGGIRSVGNGALIWFDGDPHHTSRCATRDLDTDSYGTHLRFIGAGPSRGASVPGDREVRVRRYPELLGVQL